MGIICPLDPEIRAINKKNNDLRSLIKSELKGLEHYDFIKCVEETMAKIEPRYLYNEGILQDIQRLHVMGRSSMSPKIENNNEQLEDEVKNSCLILQNEGNLGQKEDEKVEHQGNSASFCKNLQQNQSLVQQIDILYKKEINITEYSKSLSFFLRWVNMFQEHTFGGFLKPIYLQFVKDISRKPVEAINDIIVEVQQFGQFMVAVIAKIYGLKQLTSVEEGRLIKNDNIYNLIMCFLFKKTKIKKFILECFRHRESVSIDAFQDNLKRWHNKPISLFGVNSKFTLSLDCSIMTESDRTKSTDLYVLPYVESLKLVEKLSHKGSPITKLKIIIQISKQIMKEIKDYYESCKREVPEIDPDNLCAIVMYLLAQNGRKEVYEELKIVENFTTSNCLNCISGYYLNVFLAASESLIKMQK